MEVFAEYLAGIDHPEHRARMEEVLGWVTKKFPNLVPKIAWNQPMFTDHGTYIIGFSVAKHHLAVAPERAGIIQFSDAIVQAGYDYTKQLVRIKWERPVDYFLLEKIIDFNITDKADCMTFWRKE
ncbi:MAG: iron chaperone [Niallia sp.]